MKTKITKLSALFLAALMLMGSVAACADSGDTDETKAETNAQTNAQTSAGTTAGSEPGAETNGSSETSGETAGNTDPEDGTSTGSDTSSNETQSPAGTETTDPSETETVDDDQAIKDALADLGEIDYGGRELGILYAFKDEIVGQKEAGESSGTADVINDAVHARNTYLEERCNLTLVPIEATDLGGKVSTEASAPTGDFVFINSNLNQAATSFTVNNYLSNWNDLNINLEGPWWDRGTADFVLKGGVYFMSGSLNFHDDNVTYVLIFNKQMRDTYANTVPNPYDTVRNWEWTLDHFNTIIQGVSSESSGNGQWDELDTYGFLTTWEYGNTMFLGCDLRYIVNDEDGEPSLFLADSSKMEKALKVLDLAQAIYHDNNASFMSPPGQEPLGVTAFKENRGLFFGEVVSHIASLNADMKGDYGIVPVPKYDKAQEYYRTWTHESGSTFSITSAISEGDREVLGQIMSAYAILSHQYVKPAYYDNVLTSRNMRDADSAEMMDLIFANRVYDMGFYFTQFNCYPVFKTCVNDNVDTFSSSYTGISKRFDRTMNQILKKLPDAE